MLFGCLPAGNHRFQENLFSVFNIGYEMYITIYIDNKYALIRVFLTIWMFNIIQ